MGCTQSKSLHEFVGVAVAQSVSSGHAAEDTVQPPLPMPALVKPAAPLANVLVGGSSAGILKMLPSLFQTKAAAVGLLGDKGPYSKFCKHTLASRSPGLLIVGDCRADARFKDESVVVGAPFVRFICCAPLFTRSGHKLGVLCILDDKPQTSTEERYFILRSMAELLAEELQREKEEKKEQKKLRALSREGSRRRHAHGSAEEAMLVCDVLSRDWRISFGNAACADMLGVPHGDVTRYGVWDLLTSSRVMSSKGTPFSSREQSTNLHSDFEVEACLKGHPEQRLLLMCQPAEGANRANANLQHTSDGSGSGETRPYLVRLSRHPADPGTPVPGSPCSSNNSSTSSLSMFSSTTRVTMRAGWAELDSACHSSKIGAVRVQPHSSAQQHSSSASSSSCHTATGFSHPTSDGSMLGTPTESAPVAGGAGGNLERAASLPVYRTQVFSCVNLGELLGKGAFGRVYQGSWKGATVAVKVIDVYLDPSEQDSVRNEKAYLEAIVSKESTRHPNLLPTWEWGLQPCGATARSGPQPHQLWLVTEYCNRGSLYAAITNGRLRQRGSVCLLHVLRSAQEIAGALSYLHDREIVHRDLSSNNVLLCASGKDNRCFTIRVSDFGLSRYESTGNATTTMGTVSHMPPELLGKGVVGKFTDVYSFGILLYEMYTGKHPFEGMTPSAVVFDMAATDVCPLTFPPDAPPDLTALYKACVDFNANQRPTFDDVLESLSAMIEQAELKQETAQVTE